MAEDARMFNELQCMREELREVRSHEQELHRELEELREGQSDILQALQELYQAELDGIDLRGQAEATPTAARDCYVLAPVGLHSVGSEAVRQDKEGQDDDPPAVQGFASAPPVHLRHHRDLSSELVGTKSNMFAPARTTNTTATDASARYNLYQQGRSLKVIASDIDMNIFEVPPRKSLQDLSQVFDMLHRGFDPTSSRSSAGGESYALCACSYFEGLRSCCKNLVRKSPACTMFDSFVGFVIVLNSLAIGWSVQRELDGEDASSLEIAEYCFLAFYVVEICIRLIADGRRCFESGWFLLDFSLVSLGIVSDWIIGPAMKSLESNGGIGFLEQVLIIRILRLLRLVRALRMLELFKDMWKLVRGVMGSARTVLSACLLIAGTLYIFACVGVEVLTKDQYLSSDPTTAPIIDRYFSSLPRTMLSLVQFANYDSISAIYYPIVQLRPLLMLYFAPIILIVPVCLMNLVTATIVEHAIECAKTDADSASLSMRKRLKELGPQIKQVFKALDTSEDGKIQFRELDFRELRALPDELRDIIQPDRLADLFQFMDMDGSGELDEEEFHDGICHLALSAGLYGVSIESTQMLQLLRQQMLCIEDLKERVRFLHEVGALHCLRNQEFVSSRGFTSVGLSPPRRPKRTDISAANAGEQSYGSLPSRTSARSLDSAQSYQAPSNGNHSAVAAN